MPKILVLHAYYGCETGCCGHVIEIDGEEVKGSFDFDHPFGQDPREFAKEFIENKLGKEHTEDLNWEESVIIDGMDE